MKKFILSLAMLISLGVATTFASGENPVVENVFARQFTGAELIKWTDMENGIKKVTFTLGGVRTEAYYSQEAELLGTVRNLFYNQLPLTVMQAVSNKFVGGIVVEVMEITNVAGTNYRLTLEQKDKKYTLRVNSLGEIVEQQKTKLK